MSKLVVFGIIAFIFLLMYLRLRPFIRMMRQVLGATRQVHRVTRTEPADARQTTRSTDKLVRCAACATWTPSARAVRLRSSQTAYCSHACLEQAAQGAQRKAG